MPMFSKDKPTKRIEFDGGWVEIQHLSKGIKDQIASRLSASLEGIDPESLKNLNSNSNDLPAGMIGMVGKVQQVEYYKLAKAIKAWSSQDPITEESVQGLDEEIFNKISEEINLMNELSKTERKN
jgi:hypothetical protein